MKLLVTEREFKKLVSNNFIEPLGKGNYRLRAQGINGTSIDININIETNEEIPKTLGTFSEKIIEDNYKKFKQAYPSTDKFAHFSTTRPLRNGKDISNMASYMILIESKNFKFDEILKAMKYEVWWRKKASMDSDENKLSFMKGMESWLNTPENITLQLSEMENDEVYKELINSGNPESIFIDEDRFENL
jgi:hypothetical protein